jgi:hypothetical protein
LDRCRDEYIYRPNSNDPIIRTIGLVDEGNVSADIVQKARRVLKAKADHYRSWQQQHEKDEQQKELDDVPESQHESECLETSGTSHHLPTHDECEHDDGDEEEEGDKDRKKIQSEDQVISPSQMVRRAQPSSASRQQREHLQGHHLGGGGSSARHISDRTPNKSKNGNHPKGSFPSWVDLMVTAASPHPSTPAKEGGGGDPIVMRYEPPQVHGSEEKKEKIVNPEVLERRKSIQMLRKVDKMDWRTMLRDSTDSKNLSRPKSAGALNSTGSNKLTKGLKNRILRSEDVERMNKLLSHLPSSFFSCLV